MGFIIKNSETVKNYSMCPFKKRPVILVENEEDSNKISVIYTNKMDTNNEINSSNNNDNKNDNNNNVNNESNNNNNIDNDNNNNIMCSNYETNHIYDKNNNNNNNYEYLNKNNNKNLNNEENITWGYKSPKTIHREQVIINDSNYVIKDISIKCLNIVHSPQNQNREIDTEVQNEPENLSTKPQDLSLNNTKQNNNDNITIINGNIKHENTVNENLFRFKSTLNHVIRPTPHKPNMLISPKSLVLRSPELHHSSVSYNNNNNTLPPPLLSPQSLLPPTDLPLQSDLLSLHYGPTSVIVKKEKDENLLYESRPSPTRRNFVSHEYTYPVHNGYNGYYPRLTSQTSSYQQPLAPMQPSTPSPKPAPNTTLSPSLYNYSPRENKYDEYQHPSYHPDNMDCNGNNLKYEQYADTMRNYNISIPIKSSSPASIPIKQHHFTYPPIRSQGPTFEHTSSMFLGHQNHPQHHQHHDEEQIQHQQQQPQQQQQLHNHSRIHQQENNSHNRHQHEQQLKPQFVHHQHQHIQYQPPQHTNIINTNNHHIYNQNGILPLSPATSSSQDSYNSFESPPHSSVSPLSMNSTSSLLLNSLELTSELSSSSLSSGSPIDRNTSMITAQTKHTKLGKSTTIKSSNQPTKPIIIHTPTNNINNTTNTTATTKSSTKNGHNYKCIECSKSYSTYSGLSKHQQFHCPAVEGNQIKKQYSCKSCNKQYTSMGALKMHIRTHTLPCKCLTCGKAFSRPWLLQGHIRTHTGEKPFHCQDCNRAFADRSNLRAHLQTHSEIKKYSCSRCSKTFSRMSLLTKHIEVGCPGIHINRTLNYADHQTPT